MNGASNRKNRKKSGFTLMETVIVVAVMAILAGLAIPAVILLQKSLYIAKMDDYARQIFLAAQSEMSTMKDSGRLESFVRVLDTRLEEKPSDFPETDNDAWKDLFTVYSEDEPARNFLLRSSESLEQATENGGYFLLELNPLSGEVYSAFYSEKPFTYEDITALTDRSRSTRKELGLGYYGGGAADSGTISIPRSFYPTVNVVNGEELYVSVTCNDLMSLRRTQRYLTLTVTVTDESEKTYRKTYHGGSDFFVINDSVSVQLILDSLEEKNAFKKTGLTPGDDLNVTAELRYEDTNKGLSIQGGGTVSGVNSLFAAKEKTDGSVTVQVSKVRHLNNLRKSIYTSAPSGLQVLQTAMISFDFSDWKEEDFTSVWTQNPLEQFAPIVNSSLSDGSFDGQENEIRGFLFAGTDQSGLFASLENVTLKNIRLTDSVSTGRQAGTLAGSLKNCTLENCGTYLNTKDRHGAYYPDMPEREERFFVSGEDSAGGLAAEFDSCTLTNCFAALDVFSDTNAGGLGGVFSSSALVRSYASGDVTTNRYGGGLFGTVQDESSLTDCYATGDVICESYGGGLTGQADSSYLIDGRAYGRVSKANDKDDLRTSGGIAGGRTDATFQNCVYLRQSNYNDNYTNPSGVSAFSYSGLRDTVTHVGESDPYAPALRGLGFPFPLLQKGEQSMSHYGDWPEAYQLQASLVYYERYADGGYGYYAKTSLTNAGQTIGGEWVLDTLRNEICVEDGYALMTIYALDSFYYDLDTGVTGAAHSRKTVRTTSNVDGTTRDQAALISENVSLVFRDASQNFLTEVSISNAKVYRLPFDLQITSRLAANTFWETLTITAYAAGSKEEVFTDSVFYYCPDFARNAVNPEPGTTPTPPDEPGGEEKPVYVRSARQLNGLSRSTYYWNDYRGGMQIHFKQETDIDFAAYTKKYCGVTYDLMDTSSSNSYRNQPIGRPNDKKDDQTFITNNFRNFYDGQCRKIIDYRCEASTYRFTGLFGEVERGTLKNIVMVASDPENHSGYIKSTYSGGSPNQTAGTGALAGLIYMDLYYREGDRQATVENCTVSGYYVEYVGSQNGAYALGGLVGFSFCEIKNSSAVCDLYGNATNKQEGRIGGLVGALDGIGAIRNCYAGGTISASNYARIAGISGGCKVIYGYGQYDQTKRVATIENTYSFCTLKRSNISSGIGWIFGVTSPAGLSSDDPAHTINLQNCYYLKDTVEGITLGEDGSTGLTAEELSSLSFSGVSRTVSAENSHPWSVVLKGRSYPFPAMVTNLAKEPVHYGDWPIDPILDQETYLVYYEQYADDYWGYYTVTGSGQVYDTLWEDKEILSAGYGFLSTTGTFRIRFNDGQLLTYETLSAETLVSCMQQNYSLIDTSDTYAQTLHNQMNRTGQNTVKAALKRWNWTDLDTVYLNADYARGIFSTQTQDTFQIRTAKQLQNTSGNKSGLTFSLVHSIRAADGLLTSLDNSGGATYTGNGYTIRDLSVPLFDVNAGQLSGLILTQADVTVANGDAALLALTNQGTIEDCSVSGTVTAQNGKAAGLVLSNAGSAVIRRCRVDGTVTAFGNAAGGALQNNGRIERCAVSSTVTSQNGMASGMSVQVSGVILNSCVSGTVTAPTPTGFFGGGTGTVRSCFTIAEVFSTKGSSAMGFAPATTSNDNTGFFTGGNDHSPAPQYTRCRYIDWSASVDANGIPTNDWPDGILWE